MQSCKTEHVEFENALSNVSLTPLQQNIIRGRYIPLIKHIRHRTVRTSMMFNTSRIIITVGSLIVPALLSIQGLSNTNKEIYWGTWVVSLFVTICNALVALFKYDKRYYYLHTILEKLISEGWQYIELTGRYSGYHTHGHAPTHENQFVFFCHAIEKIRMQQVEDEYYKLTDMQPSSTPQHGQNAAKMGSLIPPTPQQGELENLPTELLQAVKEQLSPPEVDAQKKGQADKKDAETGPKNTQENTGNWRPESVSVSFDL